MCLTHSCCLSASLSLSWMHKHPITWSCAHMQAHIHSAHTYKCTPIQVHTHMHTHTHASAHPHAHTHTCKCTPTCTHTHMQVHTHMHTCKCTPTPTCTKHACKKTLSRVMQQQITDFVVLLCCTLLMRPNQSSTEKTRTVVYIHTRVLSILIHKSTCCYGNIHVNG